MGHLPVLCPFDGLPASRLTGNQEVCLALAALFHTAVAAGRGVSAGMAFAGESFTWPLRSVRGIQVCESLFLRRLGFSNHHLFPLLPLCIFS